MKLILTHEVSGLGAAGDVVDVKDGYGRNFLLPRHLATPWSKGGQVQVDAITKARKARAVASLEEAQSLKQSLESKPVTVSVRAGQGGRLFGAVTPSDVATAVADAGGRPVDRRTIEIGNAIKTVGEYKVSVRLHPDVSATLNLQVVAN